MSSNLPPWRPVDALFPGRREAIASSTCMPPPIGCGGPATSFTDAISRKEYATSGLCQACQDKFFNPTPEDPTDDRILAEDPTSGVDAFDDRDRNDSRH